MRILNIFFILFFCFSALAGTGQTHTLESLKKRAALAKNNEQKAKAILDICSQKYSLSADSLFHYASVVKKISPDPNSHNAILSDYYTAYSLLTSGLEDSSLKIANYYLGKLKNNNIEQEAYLLFFQLKGMIYYRTNKPKETVNTFYDLLSEARQNNDTAFMLLAQRGISLSYIVNGQNQEGLKIFHNAEELIPDKSAARYREMYGLLTINASISFLHLHQATGSILYADSCEYFGNATIDIGRKTDNLFILCQGLVVKGLILSYKKKFTEAEQYLKQGLDVREKIGDTLYIISDMSVLGSFYANTKQLKKGVAICNAGIELTRRKKISPALLLLLYNALAENYKATGDYKRYGEALKLEMAIKDSLNKKNSTDELNNLQSKYDLQKQKTTIIQQKLDITQKNYWLYGSLLLFTFAVVLSYILLKNNRRKQKLKMEIMKRSSELAVKDAEESERKRIAADLHDSLGAYSASIASNIDHIRLTDADNDNMTALHELRNNSQSMVSQLSDTIWALKKDVLSLTAISDRLKIFIQKVQSSYPQITIDVFENIETDHLLPPSQAFHLFQIMKEAVNNALRHSKCRCIVIKIESGESWKINISDDGKGMLHIVTVAEGGNGMTNMKSRAKECGWKIEWQSNRPQGTQVIIEPTTN